MADSIDPTQVPVPSTDAIQDATMRTHRGGGPTSDVPATLVGSMHADRPIASVEVIAGYEILGELGRGGMGVVYKARQKGLDRLVALKMILHAEHAGSEDRVRFLREAKALAGLQHEHIVQIFEVGEHLGNPFFSLEFVEGGGLDRRLKTSLLTPHDAAELVRKLARAMHVAHQQGVIHRDLKPANVLLAVSDAEPQAAIVPKITDFGLAKRLDEHGLSMSGAVMGTPAYMAPEQARGELKDIDARSDVHALGAILYECLAGRPPFRAATAAETLMQVIADEPVALRSLQPGVPLDLETICHKCLQKSRNKRYASAEELADDLGRFLRGEPVLARPVGRVERVVRWTRRNPTAAGLLVSLVVGVVAAGSLAIVARNSAEEARIRAGEAETARAAEEKKAEEARLAQEGEAREAKEARKQAGIARDNETKAVENEKTAQENARESRRRLYAAQIMLVQQFLRDGDAAGARDSLDGCPKELRGFEYDWLNVMLNGSHRTMNGHTYAVRDVAFIGSGRTVVSAGMDNRVVLWDASTAEKLHEWALPRQQFGVACSPDGRWIAAAGFMQVSDIDNIIRIWDVATRKQTASLRGHGGYIWELSIHPDGKTLASAGEDRTAIVWDVPAGKVIRTLPLAAPVKSVAFSPDGERLVTGSGSVVQVWNARTGVPLPLQMMHQREVTRVRFSPDDTLIASASLDDTVRLWNAKTGAEVRRLQHSKSVYGLAFSPDARRLATGCGDSVIRIWDVATGREIRAFKGHVDAVHGVAFSPDGHRLVAAGSDRKLRLWDADSDVDAVRLGGHSYIISGIAWSPSGSLIASSSLDSTCRVWHPATRREVRTFKGHAQLLNCVAFLPDERFVLTGSFDQTIKLWEAATGREIRTFKGHRHSVECLDVSGDGKRIASGSKDRTVRLWDVETGAELHVMEGHNKGTVVGVRFRPGGKELLTCSEDGTIVVWDADTGKRLRTFQGDGGPVRSAIWGRDGRTIIVASSDAANAVHPIRLRDAETGRTIRSFEGSRGVVWSLSQNPDGSRLVSCGADKMLRFWDTASGQLMMTQPAHGEYLTLAVAFSPDGRAVASAGHDAVVEIRTTDATRFRFSPDPDADRHDEKYRECVAEKHWFGADLHLRQFLHLRPWDASGYARRAVVLGAMKRPNEAAVEAMKAIFLGARVLR